MEKAHGLNGEGAWTCNQTRSAGKTPAIFDRKRQCAQASMIRGGYTPFHDAAATDDRTTAGGCGLFRPGSQAVIGVLGNSVAWGTGVPTGSSWPSLLNRSLRARFGPGITVVNGAVRASTPDFASLCWAEIWGSRRAPRLDVAVVDYSASGGASQLRALQDRIASRSIPSVGVAYCMQPLYLTLLQCAATGNADVGGSAVGREAGWDWCRRWARAAATAASAQGTDASDEAFWCDRGKGPVRGPVAAAREVARFMAWGVLKPPLVQHAMKLYADALNGTDDQGRAGVRAAFVVAAALSAELSSEPRSVDALLTRDDAPRPSGALRFPPGGAAPAPCRRPGPPVRCRYGGHCGGHCQGAARLLRLAVRRCGGAAPQENRTPMLLSRAATALAAHGCNATDYHLELRQRSAVVAFPRELLAVPRPNASVHGDGKHPGALGHVAMAASVEARRSRCNPACWRLQPRGLEAATPRVLEAATPRAGGCNPACLGAAALRAGGCHPMHPACNPTHRRRRCSRAARSSCRPRRPRRPASPSRAATLATGSRSWCSARVASRGSTLATAARPASQRRCRGAPSR